jgi:hypothetical protein
LFINLKLIIPINWSEKNIIISPAIILKISELVKKNFPINEAVEPKAIKTKEKPKVKKIVLITTKFFFFQLVCQMMFRKYKKYIQVLKEEHKVTKN